jgi:hypothetical protein
MNATRPYVPEEERPGNGPEDTPPPFAGPHPLLGIIYINFKHKDVSNKEN